MIGPLNELSRIQRRRLEEEAAFARRLHPARTVFLHELLEDVRDGARMALLRAPWLDVGRFAARLAAACVFLDAVAPAEGVKGWEGMPFVFFQSGSGEEDAAMHRHRLSLSGGRYAEACAHLPPAAHYLHLETNFAPSLQGTLRRRNLVIAPHFGLAPMSGNLVYDGQRRPYSTHGLVLGYRLTGFPGLLAVGATVATDYFVRMVVHDLCHYFLPPTPTALEGFHNAAALTAMGELPPVSYRDAWERLVHQECIDPAFCLRAGSEIEAIRRTGPLSLVQERLLKGFERWYVHPKAERKRLKLWGLAADGTDQERASRLRGLIRQAQSDGFRLNVRLLQDA